jgi:hypothetical protein
LLTVLVVGVVPAVTVLRDAAPLQVLAGALACYGLVAVATRCAVPAVVASIPVLVTVNADLPLWTGPNDTVELAIVLGDLGVSTGLALLAWRIALGAYRRWTGSDAASDGGSRVVYDRRLAGDRPSVVTRRYLRVVGLPAAFLAAFAIWALVGAAFAAHDAETAAAFGVSQFRYVGYVAVVAGLVAADLAGLRSLAIAYATGMVGQAGFALAQFWNGDAFGLSTLGEAGRIGQLTVHVLGAERASGRFLGGLTGNNAAFASLAIPAAAVLVWIALGSPGLGRAGSDRAPENGANRSGSSRNASSGNRSEGDRRLLDRSAGPRPIERRWPVRIAAAIGVGAIGLLCIPLTQYDSATLGFVATVAGAVVLASLPAWPRGIGQRVRANRGAIVAASLVTVVAAVVAVLVVGATEILEALPLVSSQNLETRLADYRQAVELAVERPLFGYGGGNVETVGEELGFSANIAIHSILFSYLAETGVVGAGLWVGAVVATGVRATELAWSEDETAVLAGVLCVGAVGFLVVAMIDQIWDNHTSLGAFWLFAGAIVATAAERDSG